MTLFIAFSSVVPILFRKFILIYLVSSRDSFLKPVAFGLSSCLSPQHEQRSCLIAAPVSHMYVRTIETGISKAGCPHNLVHGGKIAGFCAHRRPANLHRSESDVITRESPVVIVN